MPRIPPPSPKGRRLLEVIVASISSGEIREDRPWTFLTYSTALQRLGAKKPEFRPGSRLQKQGLDDLNDWTAAHREIPKVSALIVDKVTLRPNPRFATSHGIDTDGTAWLDWWKEQATRSIRFDWSPYTETGGPWVEGPPDFPGYVAEDSQVAAPDAGEILRWLAAGQSEADILRQHPDLSVDDLRSSLHRAAEQLERAHRASDLSAPSTLARRWGGKFALPEDDPGDARLTYLLERYRRNRA